MKTLLPRCAVLTWRSKSNAKALLPPISFCSATVRGRGSDVIVSPGPLGSEQARTASVTGTRILNARVRVIVFRPPLGVVTAPQDTPLRVSRYRDPYPFAGPDRRQSLSQPLSATCQRDRLIATR